MPSAISAAIWIISFKVGGGRPGLFWGIQDRFSIYDLLTLRFTQFSCQQLMTQCWFGSKVKNIFVKFILPKLIITLSRLLYSSKQACLRPFSFSVLSYSCIENSSVLVLFEFNMFVYIFCIFPNLKLKFKKYGTVSYTNISTLNHTINHLITHRVDVKKYRFHRRKQQIWDMSVTVLYFCVGGDSLDRRTTVCSVSKW